MNDLKQRLRGNYSVGPNGVYEDRNFGTFTPAICSEAADYIQKLEAAIEEAIKASENSLDIGYYNDEDVIRIDEALTIARNTLKAAVSDH